MAHGLTKRYLKPRIIFLEPPFHEHCCWMDDSHLYANLVNEIMVKRASGRNRPDGAMLSQWMVTMKLLILQRFTVSVGSETGL